MEWGRIWDVQILIVCRKQEMQSQTGENSIVNGVTSEEKQFDSSEFGLCWEQPF